MCVRNRGIFRIVFIYLIFCWGYLLIKFNYKVKNRRVCGCRVEVFKFEYVLEIFGGFFEIRL